MSEMTDNQPKKKPNLNRNSKPSQPEAKTCVVWLGPGREVSALNRIWKTGELVVGEDPETVRLLCTNGGFHSPGVAKDEGGNMTGGEPGAADDCSAALLKRLRIWPMKAKDREKDDASR